MNNIVYRAVDIDYINALENGTLLIVFQSGNQIETNTIDFVIGGLIKLGHIYSQKMK